PWLTLVLLVACTAPDSKGPDRVAAARPIVEVPVAGAGWLARARAHIADREYWASESKRGLQAPNRRHDFRTYFSNEGVRVHDRTAHGSPALVEFELVRLRRGDVSVEVAAGEVSYVEGRVEIARNDL